MRGIVVITFCVFASTALAADPCRSKNYYKDLDKKPLTYWVFSPSLQRCILVFSGNGFGGMGEGAMDGKASGSGGQTQPGESGSGSSAGTAPELQPQKPSPAPSVEPTRDVASTTTSPEFEITFHGTPKEFKSPPAPAMKPNLDKNPTVQSEPDQEKPKVPDLS